jgi:hypothetical protein
LGSKEIIPNKQDNTINRTISRTNFAPIKEQIIANKRQTADDRIKLFFIFVKYKDKSKTIEKSLMQKMSSIS